MTGAGRLYGVGVGPGDPELMTLKSVRILQESRVVAYFSRRGSQSRARAIAAHALGQGQMEIPLAYPVTTEFPIGDARYERLLGSFYDEAAQTLSRHLSEGRNVAALCEGDPFLYGSFMHLHKRLAHRFSCHVVPGITGMAGCWASAGLPMAWGSEVLSVIPGTLPLEALVERLRTTDAAVIMKVGRNIARVRQALSQSALLARATYIEYGTTHAERALPMQEKTDDAAPYFSLVLVPGRGA